MVDLFLEPRFTQRFRSPKLLQNIQPTATPHDLWSITLSPVPTKHPSSHRPLCSNKKPLPPHHSLHPNPPSYRPLASVSTKKNAFSTLELASEPPFTWIRHLPTQMDGTLSIPSRRFSQIQFTHITHHARLLRP